MCGIGSGQQDHSAVREAERATSMARTIERAYARTGRERPEPTVHGPSQERERERQRDGARVDLDRVWERPLIGNGTAGYLPYARACNYGDVHPQNQERFWTERAAMDAGYRRAANDHYGPGSGQAREAAEERAHTDAWRRTKRRSVWGRSRDTTADDMGHGAHVHLDDKEHSR